TLSCVRPCVLSDVLPPRLVRASRAGARGAPTLRRMTPMSRMSTSDIPRGDTGPRHVRLQVELVLEVTDPGRLTRAASESPGADQPRREDEPAAVASLIGPVGLVADVPGVELVRAAWSCAHTEYNADDEEWDLYEDEDD